MNIKYKTINCPDLRKQCFRFYSRVLFDLFTIYFIFLNKSVLKLCKLLFFADDMKFFGKMYSLDDCLKLQSDLNDVFEWSNLLGLTVNFEKCYIISFAKKHYYYLVF